MDCEGTFVGKFEDCGSFVGTRTTESSYGLSPAGASGNKPSTDDVVIALQHKVDRFRIGDMFLLEDSFR